MAEVVTWTRESILEILRQNSDKLKELGVIKLGLFGSYVRGEQTPESDMDFLVTLQEKTFDQYMQVWNFLEDLFKCKVDLIIESGLRDKVRPYVMKEIQYIMDGCYNAPL